MKFTLLLLLSLCSLTFAWKSNVSNLLQITEEPLDEEAMEAAEQEAAHQIIINRSAEYSGDSFVVTPEDVQEDIERYNALELEVDGDEIVEIHGKFYKDEELEDKIEFYYREKAYMEETGTNMVLGAGKKEYIPAESV